MPRRVAIALLAPPIWVPPSVDPLSWRLALAEDLLDVFAAMVEVDAAVAVQAADADLLRQVGWPGLRGYVLPALDVTTAFAAAVADGYDQAVLLAADAPDLPGMLIAKLLRPLTSRPVAAAAALRIGSGASVGGWSDDAGGTVRVGSGASVGGWSDDAGGTVRAGSGASSGTTLGRSLGRPSGTADDALRADTAADLEHVVAGTGDAARGLFGLSATLPAVSWLPPAGLDDLTPQSLRRLAPQITDVAPAPGWHRLRGPADLARLDPRLEGWDATRLLLSASAR